MRATVVIGAGWGDEGKGLMTDYFSDANSLVCRFNGGAQAGHTVVRDGKRHIFSHYGSGTLKGARTYLSEHFIFNPVMLEREFNILSQLGGRKIPIVYVNGNCRVTTPFDVMLNMIVEESRGNARHGSCGVGIFETIHRNIRPKYRILYDDCFRDTFEEGGRLSTILKKIQLEYVPARLTELGIKEISAEWKRRLENPHIIEGFLREIQFNFKISNPYKLDMRHDARFPPHSQYVFEGAQGLMLSETNKEYFPHLTPSNTGIGNVLETLCANQKCGEIDLEVVYCTRAYATRHGAGKFPRHDSGLAYEDATNAPNPWQGSLRFGHLDLNTLADAINRDFAQIPVDAFRSVKKGLAITCMDQVGPEAKFWIDNTLCEMDTSLMAEITYDLIGAETRYQSFGPTANDVMQIE